MKIAMMSRWNIPCGVSLHAELVGRAWVEMGHDLQVLAPVEWEGYQSDADEPYVERCYRLPKPGRKEDFFFNPKPFVEVDCDIFVVQNLEIPPHGRSPQNLPIHKSQVENRLRGPRGKTSQRPRILSI